MPLPALLRFLHAAPAEGVADADLLRRFAAARDEAAFELLVRRHAELVWKVCRGVLRQEADAEDAFQATFLALAKRAGSVRGPCVAGWLHRVAVRAALKLRARAARSAAVELPDLPAPAGPDPELAAAVHEELSRLADRDRLPVLLCDLEGHTHAEAAKALGWPVGTVSGRLVRGRDRLRGRLERRGVAPAAVLVAAVPGGVSGNLIRSAVSAVGGGASPAVVSLAEGVLSAMRTAKLKLWAAMSAVAIGLIGTGVLVAVGQDKGPATGGKPQPAAKTQPGKPDPAWNKADDVPTAFPDIKPMEPKEVAEFAKKWTPTVLEGDRLEQKLRKIKLRTLLQSLVIEFNLRETGVIGREAPEQLLRIGELTKETVSTALELNERPESRKTWLEFGIGLQKYVESMTAEGVKTGTTRVQYLATARRYRLDAEIALIAFQFPPGK